MKNAISRSVATTSAVLASAVSLAIGGNPNVRFSPTDGSFSICDGKKAAFVRTDAGEWPGVLRAAKDLQADIQRVTGKLGTPAGGGGTILIGTIGHSPTIDGLIQSGKLDVSQVKGRWEASVTQVVDLGERGRTLVIAGSDRRGTIFGIYDLSRAMGVSPWYWWADVPVKQHSKVFVEGHYVAKSPVVKYRGIFLNDEEPGLGNWAREKFGGINSRMYAHVFELLLRLRANYLWPAMWGKAFAQDDPESPKLADEYGIVMGTSHVEPMMRADIEWNRLGFGEREWNYETHPNDLEKFWREGVSRNRNYETITTMAMRGKVDTPMTETANIALLEKIVAAQRRILTETVNPDVTQIPQLWCLYKEVQEYYEKGMRVPDDITLLWSDDNWGNIRRLPTPEERQRAGGAGVYYHFDYVGGPRNYKWLDTNPLPKIWEQMTLAHRYGADQVWIGNVGDLKPMEFPIEFFLTLAQDPDAIGSGDIQKYTEAWVRREFGPKNAREIAAIMTETKRLNGRRKPELIVPTTFSLLNYREAETLLGQYHALEERSRKVEAKLGPEYEAAYFQLVLHPLQAMANLMEMYVAAAKNKLYASQGRASANEMAQKVRDAFARDREITKAYHSLEGGKWNHQMDQTHIGYTYWQQPDRDAMPAVTELPLESKAAMGVATEGSTGVDKLRFSRYGQAEWRIEVFRKGTEAFPFEVTCGAPWVRLQNAKGSTDQDQIVTVTVDWSKVGVGTAFGTIYVSGAGSKISIPIEATAPTGKVTGFVEGDGVIAIEAEHAEVRTWGVIPLYGRTLSAVTPLPAEFTPLTPGSGPRLEYRLTALQDADATLQFHCSPTLAFQPGHGIRFAMAIDDEKPTVLDAAPNYLSPAWERAVSDSVRVVTLKTRLRSGPHTLKVWAIDPALVLERIVIDLGGLKPSYLGPPESHRAR